MKYYIGIDLGTSAAKLLLVDGKGNIRKSVTREYPLILPRPGWSEQDPLKWWDAVVSGIRELTEGEDSASVRGIGAGGQMHGLVALDADGNVIRPAILWNDGRTAEEVRFLNEEIGRGRLSELTGNIAFAGFTAPKLLWLKKHEPENFARIKKIMLRHGFHIVYDKDADDQPVGDGFFFTFGYHDWTSEQLLNKILYYGIAAISLDTTGATRQGLRGCSSAIRDDQYEDLENRLSAFDHDFCNA